MELFLSVGIGIASAHGHENTMRHKKRRQLNTKEWKRKFQRVLKGEEAGTLIPIEELPLGAYGTLTASGF